MKAASSRTPNSPNGGNLQTDACRTHSLRAAAKRLHPTICLAINLIIGVQRCVCSGLCIVRDFIVMTVAAKRRHYTIRRWLPRPGSLVINIGCGTLPLPGREKTWRIFNLEVQKIPVPNLVLYDGSVFPFKDSCFEAGLCLDVLEHVEDDLLMLREIARVLKPKGALVLTTPCTDHDFKEIRIKLGKRAKSWSQAESHWGHVRPGYRVGDLVCLCQKAGLSVTAVEKYGATLAHAVFQLWYLGNLARLFSKKLVLPRLLMEIALRLDHVLWPNRGCAIAVKAVKA